MFSTDEILISASAAPHCGGWRLGREDERRFINSILYMYSCICRKRAAYEKPHPSVGGDPSSLKGGKKKKDPKTHNLACDDLLQ